jgi:hypothetical protein
MSDGHAIRRSAAVTRARAARSRWIARKEKLRAQRAVAHARQVYYGPLVWLDGPELDELDGVELEPGRLTAVPEHPAGPHETLD